MSDDTQHFILYYIVAPLLVLFIAWFAKTLWNRFRKTKIRVLVHEAYFRNRNDHKPYYFIKVANLSTKYKATISHVWVIDGNKNLNLINNERILPYKLEPSDEWETWVEKNKVINQSKIFKNVRVKLTNGKIVKSKHHKNVPEEGHVAGN